MDLELSEDEAALRDNVRAVLTGVSPPAAVRAVYEGKGDAAAVWARMVELHWPALAIPEAHGGLGMGFVEVAIVAEELGRAVAPGPFLATVTQFVPAVREVGAGSVLAADLLSRAAEGTMTGTVALAESGRWDVAAVGTTATEAGDGWVLHGSKDAVLDGAVADEVLVVARAMGTSGTDGLGVFVVPRSGVTATPRTVVDPTLALADVVLDGVVVPPDRVLAAPGTPGVAAALDRAAQEATVALAASTVGACRTIFETTLAYAKVREQYGRPIGSFQALKHRMADMLVLLEMSRSASWAASYAVANRTTGAERLAHVAKSYCCDALAHIAAETIQLHGGIAITWEHDAQLVFKRAHALSQLYGASHTHRAALEL
jgi:alkylation response protein AidB-like acyl-CoA dehydrogenase